MPRLPLSALSVGRHRIPLPVLLAPMAGVTDLPFRQLCRSYGAGYAVGEMLSSRQELWATHKSQHRLAQTQESGLRIVQIVGHDPAMMAAAARAQMEQGADVIDINMGCPAKKVCQRLAGSALMQDLPLARRILTAVVAAVTVPVTLKIRTGPTREQRNGPELARIAEDVGIAMLCVHGRTRADRFLGAAEYDTIATIKQQSTIPVIANGDIDSVDKAQRVLAHTGVDGIMLGRAALGRPWIFAEFAAAVLGDAPARIDGHGRMACMLGHLQALQRHYGEEAAVMLARKHIAWYARGMLGGAGFCKGFHAQTQAAGQAAYLTRFFAHHPDAFANV